jgi:hypothetical protein
MGTAGMKMAPLRGIDGGGDITFEMNLFSTGFRIDSGNCGQEGFGIRVFGVVKYLSRRPPFNDPSQIHDSDHI